MVAINRDASFWERIANHPDVAHVMFGQVVDFSSVEAECVYPYAAVNGGYIFVRLDPFGRIYDLHSLFTPEGWGREAFQTAIEVLALLPGWQVITTYHTGHKQSKPPASFGFRPAGAFCETPFGNWQTWLLTRDAWEASPVYKRQEASKCQ